jgi:hypothetical protein
MNFTNLVIKVYYINVKRLGKYVEKEKSMN